MRLTVRPLIDHAFIGAAPREPSRFTASWSNTLNLLEREVYALQNREMDDPVIMIDITEHDLRLDGQLRANARPSTDAVAIAFESRRGPLIFRCDRYDAKPSGRSSGMRELWQHNVRAIALTLEALRAVDRYGATQSGEQYVGYRQIAASTGREAMTFEQATAILAEYGASGLPVEYLNLEPASLKHTFRKACRVTHPDRDGGSRTAWDYVRQAGRVLGIEEATR